MATLIPRRKANLKQFHKELLQYASKVQMVKISKMKPIVSFMQYKKSILFPTAVISERRAN